MRAISAGFAECAFCCPGGTHTPLSAIAEREIANVTRGRFVLLPISDETRGHGTHTRARVWKQYLEELLKLSEK